MSQAPARATWTGRSMFLFAAIGSAIGLGNIWRFPYIAYDNGGGAFLLPYVVALITAGVPVLLLDYVLGHRFRGSAPLVWRRISARTEAIGWVQTIITYIIAVYYAVILAWSTIYTWFSLKLAWGEDPEAFFVRDFLHADNESINSTTVVWPIAITLAVIWVLIVAVMALGIRKGTGMLSSVFVPTLIVLFLILVGRSLFLPGAGEGLEAFFTPRWSALADPTVWMAAYGQIFYSLAIAFGIMMTQASYLKRRSNLSGLGTVVGLSNSGFEVLAGIGVFATLGFMASTSGVAVDEVATSGIGLAFIAFPTTINQMPGGPLFGVLFFGSLFIAGFTSLVTIVEVVVSSFQDKFRLERRTASIAVGVACAVPSLVLFPVTTGLGSLDIVDKFVNVLGIVLIAVISTVTIGWVLKRTPELRSHVNAVSSLQLGRWWDFSLTVITPLILGITFILEVRLLLIEGYGGYASHKVVIFGWILGLVLYLGAFGLSRIPWPRGTIVDGPPAGDFGVPLTGKGAPFGQHLVDPQADAEHMQLKPEFAKES
ncbi:sodium-dependent transporter [Corynebacterium argentoratense]|uniref:sodium-dependent transporter n=1 Tax=Corynebacterium argentoratense TaxID=42817 RepID=UPI001F430117|nr:sodium-dependent transporter [Corynebacterium argentoratense]MCF1693087.1 sodium-dependent transporter [Corynebacterium argentoratense]MCF1735184.1 sodium-dependent transporter [Corynebacterium argentoratense]